MTFYDPTRPAPNRSESVTSADKPTERQLEAVLADKTENGEISELTVVAEGEERVTWFIWILIACSSISGLLFGTHSSWASALSFSKIDGLVVGYDTGVISGALVTINGDLGPAELATGQKVCFFFTSCCLLHQVGYGSSLDDCPALLVGTESVKPARYSCSLTVPVKSVSDDLSCEQDMTSSLEIALLSHSAKS